MKNSMKTIGVLSLALMAFGAMFKIMHWPFAGMMLAIGFVFVALVFFPALLYVMYREVNQKQQAVVYVVGFITGLIFLAGVLFKIMHWPFAGMLFMPGLALITYVLIPLIILLRIKKLKINKLVFISGLISLMVILSGLLFKIGHWPAAGIFLILGAVLLVIWFIPTYYMLEVRKSEKVRLDFIFAIIILIYFIVFTFLQSFSGNKNIQYEHNFQAISYRANALYINEINKRLINEPNSGLAMQLVNQAELIDGEIEEIKVQIVQNHNNITIDEATLLVKNNIQIDDNESFVSFLLPEFNPNSPLPKLKKDFEGFNKLFNTLVNDSLKKNAFGNQLFETKNKFNPSTRSIITWEEYCLMDFTPAAALNKLSLWQYNIRLAENKALSLLVNNHKMN